MLSDHQRRVVRCLGVNFVSVFDKTFLVPPIDCFWIHTKDFGGFRCSDIGFFRFGVQHTNIVRQVRLFVNTQFGKT